MLAPDGSLDGHPGGGPYNVARTIGRLEQAVTYLGRLSTDAFGRRLRAELEADGVALDGVVATDTPTTLALAELDASGGAQYEFYDVGTSAPGLTLEEATAVLPPASAMLYVGTLGLVFEPMATTLEAVVGRVGDETLVALDPNCRPSVIDDPAAYRARLDRLLARTDVVKASEDDLAWLDPGRRHRRRRARPARPRRRGRAGDARRPTARWWSPPDEVRELASPAVEVVDTIGAGDAFMGGFLACWRRGGLGRDDARRPRPGRRRGGVRLRGRGDHLLPRRRRSAAPARTCAGALHKPSTTLEKDQVLLRVCRTLDHPGKGPGAFRRVGDERIARMSWYELLLTLHILGGGPVLRLAASRSPSSATGRWRPARRRSGRFSTAPGGGRARRTPPRRR